MKCFNNTLIKVWSLIEEKMNILRNLILMINKIISSDKDEELPPVHIPSSMGMKELSIEILSWGIPRKWLYPADKIRYRLIVGRIWEAERDGISRNRILLLGMDCSVDEIIKNGFAEEERTLKLRKGIQS